MSCTAPFSPKWAADKLRATQPQRGGPSAAHQDQPAPSARKLPFEVMQGERVQRSTVECAPPRGAVSAEAAVFEDNHALKAAVSALGSMLVRERKLKQAADERLEKLHRKLAELGAMVEEAEGRGKDGGKVWRANTKKLQNYGPLAPSSVMDPFAEEQKIMREREQRVAEKERRRREKLEQAEGAAGTATHSKSAATLMHS
jgi:hypothetical protein